MFHELIERAWRDAALKARLLNEPKACLAQNGITVPAELDVAFHENTANDMHVVFPDRTQFGGDPTAAFGAAFGAVLQRMLDDPNFEARMQESPADSIAELTGLSAPKDIRLFVHCNTPTTRNVVIPIDPGVAELNEYNRYIVGGSMQTPRAGR